MDNLILIIVGLLALLLLWIRFGPADADEWHQDPAEPDRANVRLIGRDAPRFPAEADDVLQTIAQIALSEPRTKVFDGSIDEGLITFVTRSRVMGFPDYTTFKAVDEGNATKLAVIARQRFGGVDLGVNSARLDRWLQEMEHRLGRH